MRKFITTILLAVASVIAFSGCSAGSTDLTGTWKTSAKTPVQFEAIVTDSTITINMVQDDMKALYWQGTFNPKLPNSEDTTITSTADTKALEGSVLASLDATKVFRFTKGEVEQLSFDYGFMGVTQPVYLGRV